uniref:Uncharacterized protein n=1 Tax=Anopheles farauti TaxID=69004 RepID=A0A182Q0L3_9DIPT
MDIRSPSVPVPVPVPDRPDSLGVGVSDRPSSEGCVIVTLALGTVFDFLPLITSSTPRCRRPGFDASERDVFDFVGRFVVDGRPSVSLPRAPIVLSDSSELLNRRRWPTMVEAPSSVSSPLGPSIGPMPPPPVRIMPYALASVMELRREARAAAAARGFWKTPFSIRRVMLPPVNCCTSATVRLLVGMRLCWYSCSEKSIQSFCFNRSMSKMLDLLRMVQLDVVLQILVQILTTEEIGMSCRRQNRISEQTGGRAGGTARAGTVLCVERSLIFQR